MTDVFQMMQERPALTAYEAFVIALKEEHQENELDGSLAWCALDDVEAE